MVEQRLCSFCGGNIEPGTGRLFIRKDGMTLNFCSSKCFKNLTTKKKIPRQTRWTMAYRREKETRLTSSETEESGEPEKKPAKKLRRVKTKDESEMKNSVSEGAKEGEES